MKKTLCTLALIVSIVIGNAQEFPYAINTFFEPYNPLSKALSVSPDDPQWDDPDMGFWDVPIGFEFNIMGRTATNIAIIDPGCQFVFGINQDTVNVFSPYYADIRNANDSDVVSYVKYSTEGQEGSRICKVEYQNVGFYNEFDLTGEFTMFRNYQVWLYEETNDIEFRFGPHTIEDGTMIHDQWGSPLIFFIRDFDINTQTYVDSWNLRGDVNDPSVGTVNLFEMPGLTDVLLGEPSDSTVYHFDTGIVSVEETEQLPAFNVFPTVAEDLVVAYQPKHDLVRLQIFDSSGKLIDERKIAFGNQVIHVSQLAAGNYYFTFGEGPEIVTKTIIKR
jgi:hypothetical protein